MSVQQRFPVDMDERGRGLTLALPEKTQAAGRVTRRVQWRALAIYLLVIAVGMLLALMADSDRVTALGLGVVFPGAGFIYTGQWISLLLTLLLFSVSLVVWFASGNIIAPPFIWLAAALYGAYHAGHPAMSANHDFSLWLVPAIVAAVMLYIGVSSCRSNRQGLATRRRRNQQYLSQSRFEPVEVPSFEPDYWRELTLEELKEARFVLDRALQPLDKFDGYDWVEFQFQVAAVRYQLCSSSYALSLMQYHSTPSFHGYLSQAQRNCIDKLLNKKVWGYWRWESLWGNFTTDFDPIKKDNIMLSGWAGMAIGNYTAVTGDQYYAQEGSLTFKYDDKTFAYDIHSMAKCVYKNFKQSTWTLFPCEPNWVYNMCNETAITYLSQYDRLYGTSYYEDIKDDYEQSIDNEFTTLDGRVIALRSQRMGFSVPLLTSPLADASFGMWGNATKPLHSQRVWSIFRNEFVNENAEGDIEIVTKGWDEIDVGSYKPSLISTLALCKGFASEMGDVDLADKIKTTMRKKYNYVERNGMCYYDDVSNYANIVNFYGSLVRKNSWAQLNQFSLPERILQGPILSDVTYPEVLVAKAVSHTGKDLELVLYPGTDDLQPQITLSRLTPSSDYRIIYPESEACQTLVSQGDGTIELAAKLNGRTQIFIEPVG